MNGADNSKSSSEVKSEPREKILNYKIGQNLGFKPYSDSQTTSDLQIIFEFIYAAILFLMKGEFITAILGQKNKKEKLTYNQSSIDVT